MSREFEREKIVVAQKDYVCDGCNCSILKGNKYSRKTYKRIGYNIGTQRLCIDCYEALAYADKIRFIDNLLGEERGKQDRKLNELKANLNAEIIACYEDMLNQSK